MVYKETLVDPDGIHIRMFTTGYELIARHGPPGVVQDWVQDSSNSNLSPKLYRKGNWVQVAREDLSDTKHAITLSLLAASKQVRREAQEVLWNQPFIFPNPGALHTFSLQLPRESFARIRNITFLDKCVSYGGRNFALLAPLRDATNLSNLRFNLKICHNGWAPVSDADHGERIARRLFKEMSPFIRMFVDRHGIDAFFRVVKLNKDNFFNTRFPWDDQRGEKVIAGAKKKIAKLIRQKYFRMKPKTFA